MSSFASGWSAALASAGVQFLVGVVASVVAVSAVAIAARRLLGATRVSTPATLVAAVVGVAAGWTIGAIVVRRDGSTTDAVVSGSVLAVLFAMLVVVGLELASGPRRRRPTDRAAANPVAAFGQWRAEAARLNEIIGIARRHGLDPVLGLSRDRTADVSDEELGRRLRAALEEAGGVFVKLGQLLSTRPDVFPPAVLDELTHLHGAATPADRSEIEPVLAERLGRPVDDVFESFDWQPLGSASIGQVYLATLRDGRNVVVKCRRPGIVESIERDLAIVMRLADTIDRRTSWGRRYGVVPMAEGFATDLRRELDYEREARHGRELAATFEAEPLVHIPAVHDAYLTEGLLIMDVVDGPSISELGRSGTSIARGDQLASVLFRSEIQAMVRGDTFHADPHPGNVILMADGRLGLIDFGSAGRLDAFERAAVDDILAALQLRDPTLLREAVTSVAVVGPEVDTNQLERALARLLADHLGPGQDPSIELITDFLAIVNRFRIALPSTIVMVFRALGTMLGTLDLLDPGFGLIDAAQDLAAQELRDRLSPANLNEFVRDEVVAVAPLLRRVPRHLDRLAGQLTRGELTARVSLFSQPADVAVLTQLVNRVVLGFVGVSVGLVSVLVLRTPGSIVLWGDVTILELLGSIGLFGGAVLVMRVVLEVVRPEP